MKITPNFADQLSGGAGKQKDSKLIDAAQQFEAMLMQEMLKPRADQEEWSGEKSDDSAADTISGFGIEAVAKAISQAGGLGIARQVIRQVEREHEMRPEYKSVGY